MTMEIEDLPEEPQPKRGKTKKTNVLSQIGSVHLQLLLLNYFLIDIENVDAPKKSKRGAKTLEKPQGTINLLLHPTKFANNHRNRSKIKK